MTIRKWTIPSPEIPLSWKLGKVESELEKLGAPVLTEPMPMAAGSEAIDGLRPEATATAAMAAPPATTAAAAPGKERGREVRTDGICGAQM